MDGCKPQKCGWKSQVFTSAYLARLGLAGAAELSRGQKLAYPLSSDDSKIDAAYTYAEEISHGKDTLSGHWEITGVPVLFDWGYFPQQLKCFPKELVEKIIKQGNLPGVLGEKHASGTEIIKELGEEHLKTGKPIIYTSADSVLQIAAHEEVFGLERLYELCKICYELVKPYHIARVIARPLWALVQKILCGLATGMIMLCLLLLIRCWTNW